MSDGAKIPIDLDPRKVLASLADMATGAKTLSETVEEHLGKNAARSVTKLEEAAERGTTRISTYFRNMGTRVKEDLKTAFDATGILAGAKFANELGAGVKQVFDMERAFDRLNTRLQMTDKQLQQFKKNVGSAIAGTGQKLEDVLPGVETAASKGGVKSPEQLSSIAQALGQAKATTGEDVTGLSDTIVEILRTQGKEVTGKSFQDTMDAIQSTRVKGAFGSAGDAGHAISGLTSAVSPEQAKAMGLGTREMGGLAAMASKAGAGGQDVLKHILETATRAGGKDQLNAIFGAQLFKGGKMDAGAFGGVDKKRFGQFSEQALSSATGVDQAELSRFIDAMKGGMADFNKVVSGSNETATQFATASDNLASGVDRFKEHTKEAAREVGSSVSQLGKDVVQGNFKSLWGDLKEVGKTAHENKGTLAAAGLMTAGVGAVAGGGIRKLLGKMGGMGGKDMLGGLLKGEAAKAAGIQPVYVTNAKEIGGGAAGNMVDDFLNKTNRAGGAAGEGMGKFGRMAGMAGKGLGALGAAAGGFELGSAIGDALMSIPAFQKATGSVTDMAYNALNGGSDEKAMADAERKVKEAYAAKHAAMGGGSDISAAVAKGTHEGMTKANGSKKTVYTNPSSVTGTGGSL